MNSRAQSLHTSRPKQLAKIVKAENSLQRENRHYIENGIGYYEFYVLTSSKTSCILTSLIICPLRTLSLQLSSENLINSWIYSIQYMRLAEKFFFTDPGK